MANAFFYSNIAIPTTLSGNINNSVTTCTVAATTGWPGSFPYVVALDYGTANEELVKVTANAAGTLTIQRGFGGTTAVSHGTGATVRHVYNAQDATDFRSHEGATSDVHGVTGALVGATQTQTLTNKTLTNPTVNGATVNGAFGGSPTFTGGPLFNTTPPVFSQSAAATIALATNVSGDANSRLRVQADGGLNWGPGTAPTDTNLYRSGVNTLKTDDTLVVAGEIQPLALVRGNRANATDSQFETRVGADTFARWFARADGQMSWGPGNAGADITLQRSSAGVLGLVAGLLATSSQTGAVDHLMLNATAPNASSKLLSLKNNGSAVLTVDPNGSIVQGPNAIGVQLHARKTATTTVTNNNVASDDPHLTLPVQANSIYEMDGVFYVSSSSTGPDIQIGFTGPAGSTGTWSGTGPGTSSTADPDTVRTVASGLGAGNTRAYGISTTGTVYGIQVTGMFEMAGSGGNVTVQWAQSSVNAAGTNLLLYSWFRLTKVA